MSVFDDCYRYTGKRSLGAVLWQATKNHEFRFVFLLRMCGTKAGFLFRLPFHISSRNHGIDISPKSKIGPGFYIGHAYGININPRAVLGKNINIHKGATIGRTNRGKLKGVPTIGDNVFIGINATIVGGITVGDDVFIAPNSFVNRDVPSHTMVIGNPAQYFPRENATEDYVNRGV